MCEKHLFSYLFAMKQGSMYAVEINITTKATHDYRLLQTLLRCKSTQSRLQYTPMTTRVEGVFPLLAMKSYRAY